MRSCSSLLDRYKAIFDYYETFWNTECIYIFVFLLFFHLREFNKQVQIYLISS